MRSADSKLPTRLLLAALTLAAAPAFAGDDHAHEEKYEKKCSAPAETCLREMSKNLRQRGWVGIEMNEADAEGRPVVTGIVEGSPAEQAGFRIGDALAAFNGVEHEAGKEMVNAEVKRAMVPGGEITISVLRDGERVDLEVTLGRIPEYLFAQWVGQHMLEGHAGEQVAENPDP